MSDPLAMRKYWPTVASSIGNDSDVAGSSVADALDWLDDNKQPLDATLTALAALDGTAGLLTQTGADTFVRRSLANAAAGITWTNPAGSAGNPTPVLANDLAALEGLGSTGIAVRTGSDTWAQRSIAGTSGRITATNGDGVSGNPTLDLATVLTAGGPTGAAGTVPVITWDAYGRITALTSAAITGEALTLSDSTTNNVTTSAHGFMPKAPNVAAQFFDGVASWRALVASDLGTTMQVQFGLIGVGTAPDAALFLKMAAATGSCLGSFETADAAGRSGFSLTYPGQTFRITGDGPFAGFAINDTTAAANRVLLNTSGNLSVGNATAASILGRFEARTTSGAQLVGSYSATQYLTISTASTGVTTITPVGTAPGLVVGTGIQVGTGTGRQKVDGVLSTNTTAVGNVGAGEDDLQSYTLPANSLVTTEAGIEFNFIFQCAGNANNKRFRIYAGGTKIWDSQAGFTLSSAVVHVSGWISRTGSNAQHAVVTPHTLASLPSTAGVTITTLALTETSSIVLKATGEATSDNDIICQNMRVRFFDK